MATTSTTLKAMRESAAARVPPRLALLAAVLQALLAHRLRAAVSRRRPRRAAHQGRRQCNYQWRLRPPCLQLSRRQRCRRAPRQRHSHHPLQEAGRGRDRPHRRRCPGLCQRRPARSGRDCGAPCACPQGDRQHDGGRREAVRRPAARQLGGPAARPAAGGGRRAHPARARGGEEGAPVAAAGAPDAGCRRSGCGSARIRPSRATCSSCRSRSRSPSTTTRRSSRSCSTRRCGST